MIKTDNLPEKNIGKAINSSLIFSVVRCYPDVAVVVSWGNNNGSTQIGEGGGECHLK